MNPFELEEKILEQKLEILKTVNSHLGEFIENKNSEMVAAIAELVKNI